MALRDFLEDFIIDQLELWQGTEGTDGIASIALDTLVNVSTNPYKPALASANTRLNDVTDELAKELKNGNISQWVVPRYAALLFEGMFEACVAFWIARGQPSPATTLKPDVERFVKLQVRLFTALVGAK
jgi:hypothetical protein